MAHLYNDSKLFVDMKLKASPEITMTNFRSWQTLHPNYTTEDVRDFVTSNFDSEGLEFEDWIPDDHVSEPFFLKQIQDPEYRKFGKNLNEFWQRLGRKISDKVKVSEAYFLIWWILNNIFELFPGQS